MQLTNKLIEHVNKLSEDINEVKRTVKYKKYGVNPYDTLATSLLFPPLKIEFKAQEVETTTQSLMMLYMRWGHCR